MANVEENDKDVSSENKSGQWHTSYESLEDPDEEKWKGKKFFQKNEKNYPDNFLCDFDRFVFCLQSRSIRR